MNKKCKKCNDTGKKSVSVKHVIGDNFFMISKSIACECKMDNKELQDGAKANE